MEKKEKKNVVWDFIDKHPDLIFLTLITILAIIARVLMIKHNSGDYDLFFIGDDEYSTSSIKGFKEWFCQADKYDPYSDVAKFTTEGMEEWINQGYEFAKQIRAMIPKEIKLYYGYWHQFGDGNWRMCRAYITSS